MRHRPRGRITTNTTCVLGVNTVVAGHNDHRCGLVISANGQQVRINLEGGDSTLSGQFIGPSRTAIVLGPEEVEGIITGQITADCLAGSNAEVSVTEEFYLN